MRSGGGNSRRGGRRFGWLKNPPPQAVVLGVALLVFGLGVAGHYVSSRRSADDYRYPQVVYVDEAGRRRVRRVKDLPAALAERPVFGGEVFHTSERLAEASVLASNSIVYAAATANSGGEIQAGLLPKLPPDHRSLLRGMQAGGALPPGLTLQNDLTVVSATSVLSVRYRPDPLSVEVVSVAREPSGGPALLLRLPDDLDAEQTGVRYYQAQSLTTPQIPEAFAPGSGVIKLGWLPQLLKGEAFSSEQYVQARQWLAAQTEEVRSMPAGGGK